MTECRDVMLDPVAIERLADLRARLFAELHAMLALEGGKSDEGTFSIHLPTVFAQPNELASWSVDLACYLVGPNRHYSWDGRTLLEAVDRAAKDVDEWIAESAAKRREWRES